MTAVAPQATRERASLGADAGYAVTLVLVGAAAGALAGIVVGGIAGRFVMLLLRALSDPIVIGVTSDDGFVIGQVTLGGSLQLAGGMAALGAVNGVLYVLLRDAIPTKARAVLWSLFAAAVGGSQIVHGDGIDFALLEPLWLAVAAFVALPGLAALVVVQLVERWLGARASPAASRIPRGGGAAGTIALLFAVPAALAVLLARRFGLTARLVAIGRWPCRPRSCSGRSPVPGRRRSRHGGSWASGDAVATRKPSRIRPWSSDPSPPQSRSRRRTARRSASSITRPRSRSRRRRSTPVRPPSATTTR